MKTNKHSFQINSRIVALIIYSICFFVIICCTLFRAHRIEIAGDETLYLSIPYRLCQGDRFIIDEWQVSQLSCFFTVIPMKIWLMLVGNTTGLVLASRLFFVFVWSVVALILMLRLRKINDIYSYCVSLIFLLVIPHEIQSLSYNSMGVIFFSLLIANWYTVDSTLWDYINGLLFASSILCCPHLLILYILFSLYLLLPIRKNAVERKKDIRKWLITSSGCATLAVIFLFVITRKTSISELISNITIILSDPDHAKVTIIHKVLTFFKSILISDIFAPVSIIFTIVCIIFYYISTNRSTHVSKLFWFAVLALAIWGISITAHGQRETFLIFTLDVLGAFCYLTNINADTNKIMVKMWLPANLYMFLIHLGSNMCFISISIASICAIIPNMLLLLKLKLNEKDKSELKLIIVSSFVLVNLLILNFRNLSTYSEYIDFGSLKGIKVSREFFDKYTEKINDISEMEEMLTKPMELSYTIYYVYPTEGYMYFETPMRSASYTSFFGFENTMQNHSPGLLLKYLSLHPDKIPDMVYFDKKYTNIAEYINETLNYTTYTLKTGNVVLIK